MLRTRVLAPRCVTVYKLTYTGIKQELNRNETKLSHTVTTVLDQFINESEIYRIKYDNTYNAVDVLRKRFQRFSR